MSFNKFGDALPGIRSDYKPPSQSPGIEALELIGLIAAEFKSDPQSVQCFDRRVVERVIKLSEWKFGGDLYEP